MFLRDSFRGWLGVVLSLLSATVLLGTEACTADPDHFVESVAWVSDPEIRLMPGSYSRDLQSRSVQVEGLRNETVSVQLGVRVSKEGQCLSVNSEDLKGPGGAAIPSTQIRVRFPGYVLVDELHAYVSDPLMETDSVELTANRAQGIWLTISIAKDLLPGMYRGNVALLLEGKPWESFALELRVLEATLPDPQDYRFFLNIVQDAESIARWYKVPRWSHEHFKLIERFAKDLAEHGQQSVTTTIVTHPWRDNHVDFNRLPSMIAWQYPGEWTLDDDKSFTFDYSVFDRYVEIHMEFGIRREITCLSPVVGPGSSPDSEITYLDTLANQNRTRTTQVGTRWYEAAWSDFAKDFEEHLRKKDWLSKTYLLLDEKPDTVIEGVRSVFRDAAPGLQLTVSGSSGPLGERNRLESPQWAIYYDELSDPDVLPAGTTEARRSRGQITLFYTACIPVHPNTFLYSPLRESRMLPWVAARHDVDGYIRWAWHLWPPDVWTQPRFRWQSGDMFFVYPGEHGPVDSTRWEMLRQGVQDMEALRLLLDQVKGFSKEDEVRKEIDELLNQASSIEGCRGVSPIHDQRTRINQLLSEL